ncbi:MAG: T9SS type A sorting domain-containing protein [Saprospiraceae bacterium]|nr:T9SS type A sorting domain-containing protein [Saprospiraceae bacterium]MCF8252347.1 T9SS type A sorting domain-containing protein [Saprospiraceae bacterium]MCF8282188.1 T9SS type A sorting domain-containing protein [Bacteroidales bacterium]MCF8311861.1 T9SS type A sorting domain-containing protein [Saprospiraceae bacterium]MCF8442705.1 T9SS type A sorting domain-containing protein [Saprospiraceae bacterium]
MKKALYLLLPMFLVGKMAISQPVSLAELPEAVSNNAVTAAVADGKTYVYSFSGIDSTKIWSGIHLKAWRYDLLADEWIALPPIPDPAGGKIAAAASFIKGKIYVVGGYHVAQNGNETSSAITHVFDPATNVWLPDAAPIPVPIDDHVQVTWRDSLLYVVTGWSNTTNVPNVQIFNPLSNTWMVGTPVPNNVDYKVFGASGVIVGDTIFYAGGARTGSNFPPTSFFRKGIINPNDPTQIEWTGFDEPAAKGYRMAAATFGNRPIWLGGSDVTYNFNGIAYNGSGGVLPLDRTTMYDPGSGSFYQTTGNMPAVMDIRGAAQIAENEVIIVGGMSAGQQVTNQVWRIPLDGLTGVDGNVNESAFFKIYPNPTSGGLVVEVPGKFEVEIYDASGNLVLHEKAEGVLRFFTKNLPTGMYFVEVMAADGMRGAKQVFVKN